MCAKTNPRLLRAARPRFLGTDFFWIDYRRHNEQFKKRAVFERQPEEERCDLYHCVLGPSVLRMKDNLAAETHFKCNVCGLDVSLSGGAMCPSQWAFGCDQCGVFDICSACEAADGPDVQTLNYLGVHAEVTRGPPGAGESPMDIGVHTWARCPESHGLVRFQTHKPKFVRFFCDLCKEPLYSQGDFAFGCDFCSYDLCKVCERIVSLSVDNKELDVAEGKAVGDPGPCPVQDE